MRVCLLTHPQMKHPNPLHKETTMTMEARRQAVSQLIATLRAKLAECNGQGPKAVEAWKEATATMRDLP